MKILYLENVRVIYKTAKSVQVLKTCSALKRIGVDIELVALKGDGAVSDAFTHYDIENQFPITRLFSTDIRYLSSFWYRGLFSLFILFKKFDLVYTRDLGVARIAGTLGVPFVYEMHSMPVRTQQWWMLHYIVKSKSLIGIAVISQALSSELLRTTGILSDKIRVIPCSADVPFDMNQTVPSEPLNDEFKVAYIGHLYAGKGGQTILQLAKDNPNFVFHVVGEITDPSLVIRLPSNLIHHGIKSHGDAMRILRSCHCAIAPYHAKTEAVDGKVISQWFSPLKIFEYMANKVPIVCSDLPSIREVLDPGVDALMIEPENIPAWSFALRQLADNANLRDNLSANAFNKLIQKYSYDCRAKDIYRMINEITGIS